MKQIFFGDKRLLPTGVHFLNCIKDKCSIVLRKIAPTRNAELNFGRFLNNKRVSVSTLKNVFMDTLSGLKTVSQGRHILLVEDSSEFSFGLEPHKTGLAQVGNGKELGFYLHPVLALDAADGGCLGIAEAEIYLRKPAEAAESAESAESAQSIPLTKSALKAAAKVAAKVRHKTRQKLPFAVKESYRWLSSIESALKRTPDAARHTVIADREGDIYEALSGFTDLSCDFVVRCQYLDRTLNQTRSGYSLADALANLTIAGSYAVNLPPTDKRSAHEALLDVKFGVVLLARPQSGLVKHLPKHLKVNVVQVSERPESVVNKEEPISWVLLTSHNIENLDQAREIIRFYRWRWVIEQVFRTLKSQGLDMEQSEIETYDRLAKLAILALIAAVQIMQLVQAREGQTQQPIESVFTPEQVVVLEKLNPTLEGRTEKLKNPHKKNTLAFAAWIIARLGGWSGYQKQRPPGPITMKNGLIRFQAMVQGFYIRI